MPERRDRDHDLRLPEPGEYIRVRFSTEGPEVVAFAVQYETMVEGVPVSIVRYDTRHGMPHRDTLNRRGEVIDKLWLRMSNADALDFAIADLRKNWRRYKATFLEARDERRI